jgi:hypothetical protein
MRYIPPKRRLTFNGLYDYKTELFTTTALRSSYESGRSSVRILVLSQYSSEVTVKNHNKNHAYLSQGIRCSGQDSSRPPPEEKTEALPHKLTCQVTSVYSGRLQEERSPKCTDVGSAFFLAAVIRLQDYTVSQPRRPHLNHHRRGNLKN